MYRFGVVRVFSIVLGFCIGLPVIAEDVMLYKVWGGFEGRQEYQLDLFKRAMKLTEEEYPPYVISHYFQSIGSARGRREMAKGNILNVYVAPPRLPTELHYNDIAQIPVPVLNGLLGYRKLIVRKADEETFLAIKTAEELKQFVVGQARSWPDVEVYESAGFDVNDSALLPDLFSMLENGRFDFLPLGIMEAEKMLETWGRSTDKLTVLSSIYIYYPLPVVFQVTAKQKQLTERLQTGLFRAREDGSMEALFNESFSPYLKLLASEDYQLIVLDNPHLASSMGLSLPVLSKTQSR